MVININQTQHRSLYDLCVSDQDKTISFLLSSKIQIIIDDNIYIINEVIIDNNNRYFCMECAHHIDGLTLVCEQVAGDRFPLNLRLHDNGYEIYDKEKIENHIGINFNLLTKVLDIVIAEILEQIGGEVNEV